MEIHVPVALAALADAACAEIAIGGPIPRLCERLANVLRDALRDDALSEIFDDKTKSFVALHDPTRGLIINCSVQRPGHRTPAHDHAESWAVYGMYRGNTTFRLYDRADDIADGVAALTPVMHRTANPGDVIIVQPGQVHDNANETADTWSYNIVLRPRPLKDVRRRRFNLETGAYAPIAAAGGAE